MIDALYGLAWFAVLFAAGYAGGVLTLRYLAQK